MKGWFQPVSAFEIKKRKNTQFWWKLDIVVIFDNIFMALFHQKLAINLFIDAEKNQIKDAHIVTKQKD